jgi:hypothetical protein
MSESKQEYYAAEHKRRRKVEADAEELANKLGDFVNWTNKSEFDVFVKAFTRQHRTLQQGGTKLMMAWIKFAASEEFRTMYMDGRNQATHELAKEIVSKLEFPIETYLPCI